MDLLWIEDAFNMDRTLVNIQTIINMSTTRAIQLLFYILQNKIIKFMEKRKNILLLYYDFFIFFKKKINKPPIKRFLKEFCYCHKTYTFRFLLFFP